MIADCTKCDTARLRAKAAGHREWRTDFVCYEHAAFDLDSPEGRAVMARTCDPDQPDLFTEAARPTPTNRSQTNDRRTHARK